LPLSTCETWSGPRRRSKTAPQNLRSCEPR
jgi:hypothetical protein